MSGGSFDYLTYKDPSELVDRTDQLQHMAETLQAEFPNSRAAEDTAVLLECVRAYSRELYRGPMDDLRDKVWKAIEWWKSCDYSRDQAAEVVAKYDAGRATYDAHPCDPIVNVDINGRPHAARVTLAIPAETLAATAIADLGILGNVSVNIRVRENRPAAIDAAHIVRQREWSMRTFGPQHTDGVLDHIGRELDEIRKAPEDLSEWADLILLAIDGAQRTGAEPQDILDAVKAKQSVNETRTWADWRTQDPSKAIEHIRGGVAGE